MLSHEYQDILQSKNNNGFQPNSAFTRSTGCIRRSQNATHNTATMLEIEDCFHLKELQIIEQKQNLDVDRTFKFHES